MTKMKYETPSAEIYWMEEEVLMISGLDHETEIIPDEELTGIFD